MSRAFPGRRVTPGGWQVAGAFVSNSIGRRARVAAARPAVQQKQYVVERSHNQSPKKGERFGMIRFGSRTEVYLPLDASVLVKPGDPVVGGLTIIARLSTE